jgi:hypothetical protein
MEYARLVLGLDRDTSVHVCGVFRGRLEAEGGREGGSSYMSRGLDSIIPPQVRVVMENVSSRKSR